GLRRHAHYAGFVDAAGQALADARLAVVGQREGIDVHFDRDLRLHLVHVLPAWTAGARGGGAEQIRGNDDAIAEVEVAHGYWQMPSRTRRMASLRGRSAKSGSTRFLILR